MEEYKGQPQAVHGVRECKLKSCSKEFKPKNNTQEYCQSECKNTFHKIARQKGEIAMNKQSATHKEPKGIRYANLDNSDRLQRLVRFLADGQEHSTKEIVIGADVMAVGTAVSELRCQLPKIQHYANFAVSEILCSFKKGYYYYRMIKGTPQHIVDDMIKLREVIREEPLECHNQGKLF